MTLEAHGPMMGYVMTSCRHRLAALLLTCLLTHACGYGFGNPIGGAEAPKDPPDMLGSNVKFAGDFAEVRTELQGGLRLLDNWAKLGAQIETSQLSREYSNWNNVVKEKIPSGIDVNPRLQVAEAFKELRVLLGFSQVQMATALGVTQGQVAKWETAKQTPSGQIYAALARLAQEEQKPYWLNLAGVNPAEVAGANTKSRQVPLLRDSAAAGTPRAIDEREIEQQLSLPKDWLPRGGSLYGVKVEGDSMSPILLDGHVVIVDTASRNPTKLVKAMVAARDSDGGVTIKWLRHSKGIYSLVPQHVAQQFEVAFLKPLGDFEIIGEVVMWIGKPPKVRK